MAAVRKSKAVAKTSKKKTSRKKAAVRSRKMSGAYPLSGITVIDLSHVNNGPYATFLMAMAGAEVIKIEPPQGEHLRRRGALCAGA